MYFTGRLPKCDIEKSSQLISLIKEQLEAALEKEKESVEKKREYFEKEGEMKDEGDERAITSGVFFTHAGLVRAMLSRKFGASRWLFGEK